MVKRFLLSKDQIVPIIAGFGGCLATDRIVVDGCPVGYMTREKPINQMDSGWRFFAGDESEEYMAILDHHGVYDVNTIANYDPEIVPFLHNRIGSRFERDEIGEFKTVE